MYKTLILARTGNSSLLQSQIRTFFSDDEQLIERTPGKDHSCAYLLSHPGHFPTQVQKASILRVVGEACYLGDMQIVTDHFYFVGVVCFKLPWLAGKSLGQKIIEKVSLCDDAYSVKETQVGKYISFFCVCQNAVEMEGAIKVVQSIVENHKGVKLVDKFYS